MKKKIAGMTQPEIFGPRRRERSFTVVPVPLYSPFVAAIIASTPASIPPGMSPERNRGTISSWMIRLAVTSGRTPSRP
jgi:hypothetical protein